MRCLLYLLALGRRSVDRPVHATPDLSKKRRVKEKAMVLFSPYPCVLVMCRLILPMSMYIGVFSLHHSLTLILPLKNTAFSGSEMPEGRNTDRTCHHDNGFCELPDTQTLLWGGWRERDRKREKRKGGCGIRQPHFYPLGLCGLLVFTCRISINTENV